MVENYKITDKHIDYLLSSNHLHYSLRLLSNLENFYEFVDFYVYLKIKNMFAAEKWELIEEKGEITQEL
jgi:hypothetical protein